MENKISTSHLTRDFNGLLAVEDLSLAISPGEAFAFLGPNGAGKTTTIRMLTALIQPTSGDAVVAGYKLGEQDNDIRRSVGILTENPGLYDGLSAERNLAFFGALYHVTDIGGQVDRYLRLLGLWERRQDPAGTFSKGMRQKLAIARALLHEPDIVFLDEPTSGLDPQAAHLVREFIAGLKKAGRTIFICTHNLDEAERLCDRVAVFNTRLIALDTTTALRRRLFGRKVVFHLQNFSPGLDLKISSLDFVQQVQLLDNKLIVTLEDPESQNPHIIRMMVEQGADIQFVGEIRRSLEDIYLQLLNTDTDSGVRL